MDNGAWWLTVHGVTKTWTQLSYFPYFLSSYLFYLDVVSLYIFSVISLLWYISEYLLLFNKYLLFRQCIIKNSCFKTFRKITVFKNTEVTWISLYISSIIWVKIWRTVLDVKLKVLYRWISVKWCQITLRKYSPFYILINKGWEHNCTSKAYCKLSTKIFIELIFIVLIKMFLYSCFNFYEITIFLSVLLLLLLICIIAYTYLNTLWNVYCKTFILLLSLSLLLFMMWGVPPGIALLHLQKLLSFYFHPVCIVLILN